MDLNSKPLWEPFLGEKWVLKKQMCTFVDSPEMFHFKKNFML